MKKKIGMEKIILPIISGLELRKTFLNELQNTFLLLSILTCDSFPKPQISAFKIGIQLKGQRK